jgi:hypothetical protein
MKVFVVMNEIQKNIWEILNSQHVVLDIVDFLKKVNSNFYESVSIGKKIIEGYERQLVCLDLTSQINNKFAKMDLVKRMCGLFDDGYKCGDFNKPFEYQEDQTISDEKFLMVAKKIFEFWRLHLKDRNAIDRSDLISLCVRNLVENGYSGEYTFESVDFHDSINVAFPEFCKVFC